MHADDLHGITGLISVGLKQDFQLLEKGCFFAFALFLRSFFPFALRFFLLGTCDFVPVGRFFVLVKERAWLLQTLVLAKEFDIQLPAVQIVSTVAYDILLNSVDDLIVQQPRRDRLLWVDFRSRFALG